MRETVGGDATRPASPAGSAAETPASRMPSVSRGHRMARLDRGVRTRTWKCRTPRWTSSVHHLPTTHGPLESAPVAQQRVAACRSASRTPCSPHAPTLTAQGPRDSRALGADGEAADFLELHLRERDLVDRDNLPQTDRVRE
eukprot:2637340-Rhodomonas_salina.4